MRDLQGESPAAPGEGAAADRAEASRTRVPRLPAVLLLLLGLLAGAYLDWAAIADPLVYRSDTKQAPHWAAYHTDTFRDDDLLLRLAAHNESPLVNAIYWIGTLAVDWIKLGNALAVIGYGLTAALFYAVVARSAGPGSGTLAALCFLASPLYFDYYAGGFSQLWMIPVLLLGLHLLERESWRGFLLLMPFGAIAHPVLPVLLGAVFLVHLLLLVPERGKRLRPALLCLCLASALALCALLPKYLFPPAGIGTLTPGSALRGMPELYEHGMNPDLPVPGVHEEIARHLAQPFVVLSALVFLVALGRRRAAWTRPMTSLLLASLAFYLLADLLFMNFYLPDRYTRYSAAVLLPVWLGWNWARVLALVPWRTVRVGAVLVALSLAADPDHYRYPGNTSRHQFARLHRFLATLPPKVLIAGPPMVMDDVPIQARRSVLCNYKLAHPWYGEYYGEIRRRTEATFDALYALEPGPVDRLHREWGVTHLVVVKRHLSRERMLGWTLYVNPYNAYIEAKAKDPRTRDVRSFVLWKPPADRVVYEDRAVRVVALPLGGEPAARPPG